MNYEQPNENPELAAIFAEPPAKQVTTDELALAIIRDRLHVATGDRDQLREMILTLASPQNRETAKSDTARFLEELWKLADNWKASFEIRHGADGKAAS